MYQFLSKNGLSLSFIVGILVTALFMGIAISQMPDGVSSEMFLQQSEAEMYDTAKGVSNFNFGFYATFALLVIAAAAAIILPIIYTVTNPGKGLISSLIMVVALAVIFIIGYFVSGGMEDTYPVKVAMNNFNVNEKQGQFIGGTIITTLILLGLGVLVLFLSEVRNLFK